MWESLNDGSSNIEKVIKIRLQDRGYWFKSDFFTSLKDVSDLEATSVLLVCEREAEVMECIPHKPEANSVKKNDGLASQGESELLVNLSWSTSIFISFDAGFQPRWIQGIRRGDGIGEDQETIA